MNMELSKRAFQITLLNKDYFLFGYLQTSSCCICKKDDNISKFDEIHLLSILVVITFLIPL